MTYASNVHIAVYQVLDQVLTANMPPPGAKAMIHSIIDDLHAASAPQQLIASAESISLHMHYLERAAACSDAKSAAEAHRCLRSIAASWLEQSITN